MVAPGGGSTPPTITWLSSPPTWQPITVIVRSHFTFSVLSARGHAHGIGRAGGGSTVQSLKFAPRRRILGRTKESLPDERGQRTRIPRHPRTDQHPRRGARRHAPPGDRYLLGRHARYHPHAPRGHAEDLQDHRQDVHLRRQRPRGLG